MSPTTTTTLDAQLAAAGDEIALHLETLRGAARAINALGALASRVQGAATDADFEVPREQAAQKQRLQDLLQRTGYVNLRSGDLATKLRDMHQGLLDLAHDVTAVRAAFTDTGTAP